MYRRSSEVIITTDVLRRLLDRQRKGVGRTEDQEVKVEGDRNNRRTTSVVSIDSEKRGGRRERSKLRVVAGLNGKVEGLR